MEAHNLDLKDIQRRLQQENFYMSAGTIDSGETQFRVYPMGEYKSLEEIRSLPMNDTGLVLQDFATVTLKPDEDNNRRKANGVASLGISVYKLPEANLVAVSSAISSKMDRIKRDKQFANTTFYPLDLSLIHI